MIDCKGPLRTSVTPILTIYRRDSTDAAIEKTGVRAEVSKIWNAARTLPWTIRQIVRHVLLELQFYLTGTTI